MKNILITGSNGFIGNALFNKLSENPKLSVKGVDLYDIEKNNCYNIDLSERSEIFESLVKEADIIFHFAASVGVENINFINSYKIDNNLFNIIENLENPPKIIYASSSEVFGDNENITDASDFKITNIYRSGYAIQKLMSERLFQPYGVIVRFFNVIGLNQSSEHGFVIPRFIESAKNNEDILVYQPDSTRSFIDLRNVVDILEKLINENPKQLNIGTDKKYTILEVAEITKKIFESSSEIKIVSKRNDEIKHRNVFTDLSKYVEDFYTLEDTLRYIKDNK